MTLSEKSAYLKGLMDGLKLDTEKDEGKMIAAIVDMFLLTGGLLFWADRMGHGNKNEKSATLSDALVVGLGQAAAVVPGLSRSGATISAGMLRGFDRSYAVRFSFLLSIPTVLGANLLSLIDAIKTGIDWSYVPMKNGGGEDDNPPVEDEIP